ncbi:acyl-CoA dehydrogenase family protein [Paraburkholderia rhizosphaerae]|uniref:Alkylation response protein AidB-like acyl-CoA dehydrogenase n=1 Tax=Paraburkholderia rhizosphaerae TaxID=480658 RepID=A0A4R8LIT0_9BURK|nr:acyl-CoA dehydrogenase family protein [Paraburkholderia rhizosphaerae]TDY43347.1 alkylation response protein AidB-like acyl-CoA dehydrogenase [Paraburkholderia rhizosphaerae]
MTHTSSQLLADIERLAPSIAQRTAEIEARGQIPPDLIETLRSIGVFRMFVPRQYGGSELDFPLALEIFAALGKIDGSLGWTAMIGAGAAMIAPVLPEEFYDRIYQGGPDIIIAGSAFAAGTAEPVAGGWRVTGRWPFASGCQHADWILGLCVMNENGVPVPGPGNGAPMVRGFFLPAREWHVEDNWHVVGLKGTGSNHVTLDDTLVPASNFFNPGDKPRLSGPLYGAAQQLIPLMHAANNLGIAEGSLDDLVAFATSGHRQQRAATAMRDSEFFQAEVGRIHADLRAARAFLRDQAASHWRHALAGTLSEKDLLVEGSQMATWIANTCVRAADACFALGGSNAIYETSPLQRRMRDLHAAAQHAAVQQRNYISGGTMLLGRDGVDKTTGQ